MAHNADNERAKRSYLSFLKEATRYSEATVDAVAQALALFEADTNWRDFRTFRSEQAIAFKKRLAARDGRVSGQRLSKATQHATLAHLKRFFQWLSMQPRYKSRLKYTDAEYFNLTEKEARVATARRDARVPTLDQVRHVIDRMGNSTEIERRNRALVALILLTGARDRAVASLKLRHIDVSVGSVYQDARDVQTKNSKTFVTYFFPVGAEVRQILVDWVVYLRTVKLWGNDDPLFPATEVRADNSGCFAASGLTRRHWSTAAPIRAIFRESFANAGLEYFNPHSLRNTLSRLGEVVCRTPEEFKAWSQNLGHEQVLTTFRSYGHVATRRQAEIIRDLSSVPNPRTGDARGDVQISAQLERIHAEILWLKESSRRVESA